MSVVACLHPRQWDGRRLLQFLTGLALIALAFAAPALAGQPDAPEQTPVVTTVDAPTGGPGLGGRIVPVPRAADDGAADAGTDAGTGEAALGDAPARVVVVPVVADGSAALSQPARLPGNGADQRPFAGRAPPRA